jgi:hypothetical protein
MQDHMLDLYTWARGWPKDIHGKGPHIVEIGVRTGNSTCAFLAALEVDRRGTLWSIDLDEPDVPDEWHDLDCWQFHQGDSRGMPAREWGPLEIDCLFIDGDHRYGHVLEDLRSWAPRVRKGGVILMHDTEDYNRQPPHRSEVAMALDSFAGEASAGDRVYEWRNKPGCFGLGIMRVREAGAVAAADMRVR